MIRALEHPPPWKLTKTDSTRAECRAFYLWTCVWWLPKKGKLSRFHDLTALSIYENNPATGRVSRRNLEQSGRLHECAPQPLPCLRVLRKGVGRCEGHAAAVLPGRSRYWAAGPHHWRRLRLRP